MTILEEDEGENCVASMASPWPGIEDEHRDTARTRKMACGVYWRVMRSSVVFTLGRKSDWYISVVMSSTFPVVEGL